MRNFAKKQLYLGAILLLLFVISTAGFFLLRLPLFTASAEIALSGDGSEGSPYLIEDEEDYIAFTEAVNDGEKFSGKYVSQTANLDFSSYGTLDPIGIYGEGNYFYGIYDGGGYKISNIKIDIEGNGGMFGMLGGTVRNVNIASGSFKGQRIGCIAYSAASSLAKVINCYTSASVEAEGAGGITFMFNVGGVYNCLTVSSDENGYLPVNGAYSVLTYNSYTMGERVNGIALASYSDDDCAAGLTSEEVNASSLEEALNGGAVTSADKYASAEECYYYSPWRLSRSRLTLVNAYSEDFSSYSLSGKGSKGDPYLISSAKDFRYLAYAVNSLGKEFKGVYFRQTEDIDFKFVPMKAVATIGSGKSFNGIYDGGGHAMKNYRIYEGTEQNTAFFGLIGGVIYNLGLEKGYIYGNCASGIAVNSSSGETIIFNCYSKAALGGRRGGGIVDNFSGSVITCLSSATFNGKAAPVAGYLTRIMTGCYSTGEAIGENFFDASINNNTLEEEELYSSETAEKLNLAVESEVVSYDFSWLSSASLWSLSSEEETFFSGSISSSSSYNPHEYFGSLGTSYDPYIIDSVEDFVFFHNSVNAGCKYSGRTVKQATDIDFDELYLTPIGIYGSDELFCGVYDGAGHVIKDLNIYISVGDLNAALFGSLAGSIYNLGYDSGTIYGSLAAGIAYYGAAVESTIINCYFTGEIDAYRASGISDTFRGSIINCWCDCADVKNSSRAPLNAIVASYIRHSYSTGGINGQGINFDGSDSSIVSSSDITKYGDTFATLLNAGCLYAAKKNACVLKDLVAWSFAGKKITYGDYFTKNYRDCVTSFSGNGTSVNPYKIEDAEDLYNLQLVTSAGETYKNQYFVQTANIDCSSLSGAVPIGSLNDYNFSARYDGGGYAITNLNIVGIAYSNSAAFISHLGGKLVNVCLYESSTTGQYAAGLVLNADVKSEVKIINCIVCKTTINGVIDGAGLLLYGREADIYNSIYLVMGGQNTCAVKEAGRLFGVYTDGELYGDYEYVTADECYIITTLPTVQNRVTYTEAIKELNANILKLKQDYGMNIVGQVATFRADGKGGVLFGGMFSISFSNLAESIATFGNEISLYFLIYLGVGAIGISFVAEVALRIKKKREKEAAAGRIRRGALNDEQRAKAYGEFYAEREIALSLAEDRLIGKAKKKSGSVARDAARVNVAGAAAERKAAKKRAVKKIGVEKVDLNDVEVKYADDEGKKPKRRIKTKAEKPPKKPIAEPKPATEEPDEDEPLVFSIEDILSDDKTESAGETKSDDEKKSDD